MRYKPIKSTMRRELHELHPKALRNEKFIYVNEFRIR